MPVTGWLATYRSLRCLINNPMRPLALLFMAALAVAADPAKEAGPVAPAPVAPAPKPFFDPNAPAPTVDPTQPTPEPSLPEPEKKKKPVVPERKKKKEKK